MAKKDLRKLKVGRNAQTGKFMPVKEAAKRPGATVVERVRGRTREKEKQHTDNTGPRRK